MNSKGKFDESFGNSIKQMDWSKEKLRSFSKNFYKVSKEGVLISARSTPSQLQSQKKKSRDSSKSIRSQ